MKWCPIPATDIRRRHSEVGPPPHPRSPEAEVRHSDLASVGSALPPSDQPRALCRGPRGPRVQTVGVRGSVYRNGILGPRLRSPLQFSRTLGRGEQEEGFRTSASGLFRPHGPLRLRNAFVSRTESWFLTLRGQSCLPRPLCWGLPAGCPLRLGRPVLPADGTGDPGTSLRG